MKELLQKLKNSGFHNVFISSAINKIVSFAYGIILVRVISKAEYGIYTGANNRYSYFALFLGLGIASAILQICSENIDEKQKEECYSFGFSASIYINFLLAITIGVSTFLFPIPIEKSNRLLLLMALLPVFTQFTPLFTNWLRSATKNKEYARLNNFNSISIALLSIVGALTFDTVGVILGRYLAGAVTFLYATIRLKCPLPRVMTIRELLSFSEKKKILHVAVMLCFSEAIVQVISLIGVTILTYVIPDEEIIASYKTATIIPTALGFIANAIMIYAYPFFVRNRQNKEWTIKTYGTLSGALLIIGLGISTIGIIFSKFIISLIFGEQYLDSLYPFIILMVTFFVNTVLRTPAANLVISQYKLKFSFVSSVAGAILTIVMNIFLIPLMGSNGAAYAQLISTGFIGIVSTIYYIAIIHRISGGTDEKAAD